MPKIILRSKIPSKKEMKDIKPIAIVKGEKNKFYNQLLCVDTRDNHKAQGKESIEIPDENCFQVLPDCDKDKRSIYYIAGASGSGKSYIARTIADNYKKLYPNRQIYVISKLDKDETLDAMKEPPVRIQYEALVENPIDINAFSNSLVIFDDYDTIEGKAGEAVHSLINDIAIMGRKHHDGQGCISMLCLTHHITNYKKTRLILNEASHFVVYPQATSTHALTYLLKTHLGLERDDIKKLKKLGRWVCFGKMYPQYLLSGHKGMMLHGEEIDGEE